MEKRVDPVADQGGALRFSQPLVFHLPFIFPPNRSPTFKLLNWKRIRCLSSDNLLMLKRCSGVFDTEMDPPTRRSRERKSWQ